MTAIEGIKILIINPSQYVGFYRVVGLMPKSKSTSRNDASVDSGRSETADDLDNNYVVVQISNNRFQCCEFKDFAFSFVGDPISFDSASNVTWFISKTDDYILYRSVGGVSKTLISNRENFILERSPQIETTYSYAYLTYLLNYEGLTAAEDIPQPYGDDSTHMTYQKSLNYNTVIDNSIISILSSDVENNTYLFRIKKSANLGVPYWRDSIILNDKKTKGYPVTNVSLKDENTLLMEFDGALDSGVYYLYIPAGSLNYIDDGSSSTVYCEQMVVPRIVSTKDPTYQKLITYEGDVPIRVSGTNTILLKRGATTAINIHPVLNISTDELNSTSTLAQDGSISGILKIETYSNDDVLITKIINLNQYYDTTVDLKTFISDNYLQTFNYVKITFIFTYNGHRIEQPVEFNILPETLYNESVVNSTLTKTIDTISGKEVETLYGSLIPTNEYDVIEQVNGKYVAELVPTTKVRMGNLKGIYNETFGTNQPQGYGLYGESVYLTGNFYLNNGKSLIDISNDILLANGNISQINELLANIDSENKGLIEALKENLAAVPAAYQSAISANNNVILKLGLDYSLWALGNAGITLINPDAKYTTTGEVDETTLGNGDEYITLQGNSIRFKINKSETSGGVTYYQMLCTKIAPAGWSYGDSIYEPQSNNENVPFFIGYVTEIPTEIQKITRTTADAKSYLKYCGFDLNNIVETSGKTFNASIDGVIVPNLEVYSFNNYRQITESDIYIKDSSGVFSKYNASRTSTIYAVQRVKTAGMFTERGKFNSSLIETENLVAVENNDHNSNFKVEDPITSGNYPANSTNEAFVVVSGLTGKITALGMDLKEATIGNNDGQHIHLTDNQGSLDSPHREGTDTVPGIYIKSGEDLKVKITSDTKSTIKEFESAELEIITYAPSEPFDLSNTFTQNMYKYSLESQEQVLGTTGGIVKLTDSEISNLIDDWPTLSIKGNNADFWNTYTVELLYAQGNGNYQSLTISRDTDIPIGRTYKVYVLISNGGTDTPYIHYTLTGTGGFSSVTVERSILRAYHHSIYLQNYYSSITASNNRNIVITLGTSSTVTNGKTTGGNDLIYNTDIYCNSYSGNKSETITLGNFDLKSKQSASVTLQNLDLTISNLIEKMYTSSTNYTQEFTSAYLPKTLRISFLLRIPELAKTFFKKDYIITRTIKNEYVSIGNYYYERKVPGNVNITRTLLSKTYQADTSLHNSSNSTRNYSVELQIVNYIEEIGAGNNYITNFRYTKKDTPNSTTSISSSIGQTVTLSGDVPVEAIGSTKYPIIPKDNYYYWNPRRFPKSYEFSGTCTINTCNIIVTKNNFQTVILNNGFGTGFNNNNFLGVYANNVNSSNPNLKYINKISNYGQEFTNEGGFYLLNGIHVPLIIPLANLSFTSGAGTYVTCNGMSLTNKLIYGELTTQYYLTFKESATISNSSKTFIKESNLNYLLESFIVDLNGSYGRVFYNDNLDIYLASLCKLDDSNTNDLIESKGELRLLFGDSWTDLFDAAKNRNNTLNTYISSGVGGNFLPSAHNVENFSTSLGFKILNLSLLTSVDLASVSKTINSKYYIDIYIKNANSAGFNFSFNLLIMAAF